MSAEFKVEGFNELFKAMDDIAEEIGQGKTAKIWRTALGYAMEPVLQAAKQNAPIDSGQLRDHIYMKAQKPQSRDKASSSYKGEMFLARVSVSPKREDSTERTILNKRGRFQTIAYNRPVALGQEFGNAHTSPHPFIRTSLESNLQNVIDRLGHAIWAEVNWGKYARKG
ncbi:phge_HK97_gp10, phage protein, HK97 gp10 family [uncultured Caudovirales phage]|uniref:Phge_HK97_gp10, phage protein, HK97 gp10 family n=1 Tax=uncultured Caudovirales phage TaxID=2100421 RepID=A0A6J5QRS9_9CAUD|nr:phge_HK97_gp10, phage protein, HK97 gp10 family [uncultured Caudovirales phage]CAB4219251.1 phge_HK97_gp10, phage protein, HK97 gp10 family [uncultured Caudovirales phage]